MNTSIKVDTAAGEIDVPLYRAHTLVLGSGAAGLNTALELHREGVQDVLIISEGLECGTSINTGSDKQTYYKLGMYGKDSDSPASLAKSYFEGGGMHGDIALVEAALSARAFLNLVNMGVPFPRDEFGQFVGYKTDHDPLQRATSCGPYTSREMCRALIREVKRLEIPVHENRVAVSLLTSEDGAEKRALGCITTRADGDGIIFEAYIGDNVVFAVGGPGGLYKTSVYPVVHTGAIGLALLEGACARGLPESQYGMASTKFRWNVSGTYMQVLPRFISTEADGRSDEKEFLAPWFKTTGEMNTAVFLKGYQWPFDPRKVQGGSSLVDILVYIETVEKGRRVFLDYRANPTGLDFNELGDEARGYLEKSGALFGTPFERLRKMNSAAIDLYMDHDIDISREPLEIAVCAQHNNGGLSGNAWWESVNIKHLFPVGEVNGSHGVYRPGGSALNSGQVAGFRAAEYIANRYSDSSINLEAGIELAAARVSELADWLDQAGGSESDWSSVREEFQDRMTRAGAHIRSRNALEKEAGQAWELWRSYSGKGCAAGSGTDKVEALRNIQLCFAHAVYLEALLAQVSEGVGSRGSALVLEEGGETVHEDLDGKWRFALENPAYREKVLETIADREGNVKHEWNERKPIPNPDGWFENVWADYREGRIYA